MPKHSKELNMKLGIMQPYFMPYIGYWQRIKAVDQYVIYDDVNYIKNGWMNHNRIIVNKQEQLFTIPLVGASPNKLINEVGLDPTDKKRTNMIKTLEMAYRKAPHYEEGMSVLRPILESQETNFAKFLEFQIKTICHYLEIKTKLIVSSNIDKDNSLKAQDKVIQICKILGATEYYNALSGEELYSKEDFSREGIKLVFIKDKSSISYKQLSSEYIPSLSIIDVLMNCSKEEINCWCPTY